MGKSGGMEPYIICEVENGVSNFMDDHPDEYSGIDIGIVDVDDVIVGVGIVDGGVSSVGVCAPICSPSCSDALGV